MIDARRVEPRGGGLDELERDVRHGEPGRREGFLPQRRRAPASTSTPFAAAFSRVTSTATSSTSTATTGPKPSLAAAIESTPEPQPTSSSEPRLLVEQELEAEAGRGVRARAERAAGVDHDGERLGGGSSHGGPTQSGPIRIAWWNSRQRSCHQSSTSLTDASGKAARTRSAAAP